MVTHNYVRFGRNTYTILSAEWNSQSQFAEITYKDGSGKKHEAIGWGMSPQEQRQAVVDHVLANAKTEGP